MNKTDLLLQMMEQPQHYTKEEWQEILADEECRELYTLMSKTQSAIDAARADKEITDDMIDAEWQRLSHAKREVRSERYSLLKYAAMFVGILMLSGIAFAAWYAFSPAKEQPTEQVNCQLSNVKRQMSTPVRFDDVRLDSILTVVSAHYGKAVSFRSEEAKGMKFIMAWNPDSSLTSFIDGLNMFDGLLLTIQQDTIFVETTEVMEDAK